MAEPDSKLDTIYDKTFFDTQWATSLASAKVYLGSLLEIWKPASVIDLGCGRGTWLSACQQLGVGRVVGVDGEWAARDGLLSPTIEFHAQDLNLPVALGERFDLAMSLEAAEHVMPKSSDAFAGSLMALWP